VRPGRYKPRILRFWDMTVTANGENVLRRPRAMSHRSFFGARRKFFDERVESVLTVASIDQRATTPGASHAPES
jgi:hypothetical protein